MLCLSHIIFFYLTPLNCDSYFACIHLICRYDDHGGAGGYDSASEEDSESIFDEAQGAPNAEEEDEDMERREEELRAELNFATCRVEELKRTLQETKSFLGPRLPTRGKDAPPTAKGREVRAAEEVFEEDEVEDEDEDYNFDESDGEVSFVLYLHLSLRPGNLVSIFTGKIPGLFFFYYQSGC